MTRTREGLSSRAAGLLAVRTERDLAIPMPDGVVLRADRRYPANDPHAPLVLLRGPYGRTGPNALVTMMIASRGYQVLQVSLRGTAGSGGRFDGLTPEPGDGPATLAWMRSQPWFPGEFATFGTSYLGYSQWELAREAAPEWRAAIIQDAASEMRSLLHPGGAFAVGAALRWTQAVNDMPALSGGSLTRQLLTEASARRRVRKACDTVPLSDADLVATGERVSYFQEWLEHPEDDGYWDRMDFRDHVDGMPPTVYLAGGWYDLFLPAMVRDHAALVRSGRDVRMRIGPWSHGGGVMSRAFLGDAFAVLDAVLRGRGSLPDSPVRVFTTGSGRWARSPEWPPPNCRPVPRYLSEGGRLDTAEPAPAPPSRYRYDPRDPTSTVGGSAFLDAGGAADNRGVEARDDVLTFTCAPLDQDLWVAGPVSARVHVRTSGPHADVFVRLCDVDPRGRSANITDGVVRLAPDTPEEDGVRTADVDLWPVTYAFREGHRLRLQVSGGAHPRIARNTGTGDQTDTDLRAVDVEVLHEPEWPSSATLPVIPAPAPVGAR